MSINQGIADNIREIAVVLEEQGGDPLRVRAYRRVRRTRASACLEHYAGEAMGRAGKA